MKFLVQGNNSTIKNPCYRNLWIRTCLFWKCLAGTVSHVHAEMRFTCKKRGVMDYNLRLSATCAMHKPKSRKLPTATSGRAFSQFYKTVHMVFSIELLSVNDSSK